MDKYLKNKYVLIGLIGIAFYLYKRRQILKTTPKVAKPIEELEEKSNFTPKEEEVAETKVGEKFIADIEKMETPTLKRTIDTNKKMLKRAKMSSDRKENIKEMLNFMKDEYADRTRNK